MRFSWLIPILLCGALAPVGATNTTKTVKLQVTLHDGTVLKGRLRWKKDELEVRGRRRKKILYGQVSAITRVPPPDAATLAAQHARRKKRLKPGDLKGWLRLGAWAQKRGLAAEAKAAFEVVVGLDPDNVEAREGIGQLKATIGWAPAETVLAKRREALKVSEHDKIVDLAAFAIAHEQRDLGVKYLVEVLQRDIFHSRALKLLKPYTDRYEQKTTSIVMPVDETWRVSTDRTRHHQKKSYAVYALDLTKVDGSGKHHRGTGRKLADHYAWGAPFYAMADGKVVEVREGQEDNAIGKLAGKAEQHNGVSLDHGNGEYSWYVHAKKGSIKVKLGDTVKAGQLLGEVGNSGGSAIPHLHVTLIAFRGISVPWRVASFEVIAKDGTPIPVQDCWPREGWTVRAKTPPQPPPPETGKTAEPGKTAEKPGKK